MNRPVRLLAVTLLLAACSSSSKTNGAGTSTVSTGPGDAQTATVSMTDRLAFAPTAVEAKVGTLTLSVVNSGQIPHNLVFDDTSLGKTPTVAGGQTQKLSLRFTKAGSYAFVCTFHSGMAGKVVVS